MMRFLILGLYLLFTASAFADSGYPVPSSPTTNSPKTGSTTTGGDNFGTMLQQQTSQAMQTFQNVNYQNLSGRENQDSFYDSSSDGSSNSNVDPNHLFNVFSGS